MFGMLFGSVKLLLKDYLATLGIQIPDGRSRKWSWCWKSWCLKEAVPLPLFLAITGTKYLHPRSRH